MYKWAYGFVLGKERIISSEWAIQLWRMVFGNRQPPVFERWASFIEANKLEISWDVWNMFLYFVETIGTDLSLYDDSVAWPRILDDFVKYENSRLDENASEVARNSIFNRFRDNYEDVMLTKGGWVIQQL